jgi:hypothetical protein
MEARGAYLIIPVGVSLRFETWALLVRRSRPEISQ